ncbi:DUF4261 domain-containing protein [Pseudoflavonifractor sp. 60]|uniref:DUF4261 domain-containing protein n=1 Tax=Pseudoflavonifractor sp. 60 TaxID=2304576 RepID=UPI00136DF455|nr:DUF4261 domain-containing protein [Pseudoflavonifractor sp. 60]
MTKQQQAAREAMSAWLAHPQELGKAPAKIEIAGEFDLHDCHYYIIKYKKSLLGKWLVGVCGFEDTETLEPCGHTFSVREPYNPADAQERCRLMVEVIRQCQQDLAEEEAERQSNAGPFSGFVLLSTPEWDLETFKAALNRDWGIDYPPEDSQEAASDDEGSTAVFDVEGMTVAASLMEFPVPEGEAEYWANSNFMERDAALAAARDHTAHVMVAVVDKEHPPRRRGELYVKIVSTLLRAPNALGVYTNGTVWLPDYFVKVSQDLKEGHLPLMDLVFVGLVRYEKGVCGWTNGLRSFGRDELEIRDSQQSPQDVHMMLLNTAGYIIQENVTLRDGETLGYTADQKLRITRSEGVNVEGMSLKIEF